MRIALYGAALLALATLSSPDTLRTALATSASALFESTPFLLAGIIAARFFRSHAAMAYLGCGCAAGPSARSLPAAAATALVFGPFVAVARIAAAVLAARLLRGGHRDARCAGQPEHLLGELAALLPSALLAGTSLQVFATLDPARAGPFAAAAAGALLAFFSAPCAVGAVAVASALGVRAPLASAAFLCVAGIVDLRALSRLARNQCGHDALAYALLAVALGAVALRHGDALVHPAMAPVLGLCAGAALTSVLLHRQRFCARSRWAPSLMLAGALIGAPPPQYRATETTLSDRFAGEHLTFTGTLCRDGDRSAVVRYAITCCRADAAPVAVRLDRSPPYRAGTWLSVAGRLESIGGDLRLVTEHVARIAPPSDPFVYR